MATYKIDIGKFDNTQGPLAARDFITGVDDADTMSDITDEALAALVRASLRGEAKTWITAEKLKGTPGLDTWSDLKPIFTERFCRPLNEAQLAVLQRACEHRAGESVRAFYTRCEMLIMEEDHGTVPALDKVTEVYKREFQRRVKLVFLQGLKSSVKTAMLSIKKRTATLAELLEAAEDAESVREVEKPTPIMQPPSAGNVASCGQSGESKQQQLLQQAMAIPGLSSDGMAMVAAMATLWPNRGGGAGNRGRGRGGRGRGNPQGGSQQQQGRPGPSLETLQAREKAMCGRCHKMVKHRTNECYTDLSKPARAKDAQTGRGGYNQTRGGYSYSNAAASHSVQDSEFTVFDEPLN
jgi:hypothetical protein